MKAVVAAFNQEKALIGAFSVLTNLRMEIFQALVQWQCCQCRVSEDVLYSLHGEVGAVQHAGQVDVHAQPPALLLPHHSCTVWSEGR